MRSHKVRGSRSGRYISTLAITLLVNSCGGKSPTGPSNGLSAPTLVSPLDDAVASGRPLLTVSNPAASGSGARTYDFQVAASEAALSGPADGLFAVGSGIAEGAGGRTSFEVPTAPASGRRYFWRARADQGGTAGPWSTTFKFRTEFVANAAPVIQTITLSSRAESRAELDVAAVVSDAETSPANLVYEWTATGGTVTGTGASVRWLLPGVTAPTPFDLNLTVIERYTVAGAGGVDEARENRVTGKATVHVNDSLREITDLATTFIDDFLHSERPPEFCVRNFSNSCPGKQEELNDILANRAGFVNNPSASSMGPGSITFYDTGSTKRTQVPPSQAVYAELFSSCRFAATRRSDNTTGVAIGTCQLTEVYENFQWRLCDSRFLTAPGLTPFMMLR